VADLLHKVFIVLVRPYFIDGTLKVFTTNTIYAQSGGEYHSLDTNNAEGSTTSPVNLNSKGNYKADPWFLHSSYTSYEDMRQSLKSLIAFYGTDRVRCATYIPVDYTVIPSE